MVQVNKNDIRVSQGDTLDITFELEGYEIKNEDTLYFTVKNELYDKDTLIVKEIKTSGTIIQVKLDIEDMAKLPLGTHYYDLFCMSDNKRVTLIFPSKIIVERVVHNV